MSRYRNRQLAASHLIDQTDMPSDEVVAVLDPTQTKPLLQASAPARIVNLTSDGHRVAKLDFDNLQA